MTFEPLTTRKRPSKRLPEVRFGQLRTSGPTLSARVTLSAEFLRAYGTALHAQIGARCSVAREGLTLRVVFDGRGAFAVSRQGRWGGGQLALGDVADFARREVPTRAVPWTKVELDDGRPALQLELPAEVLQGPAKYRPDRAAPPPPKVARDPSGLVRGSDAGDAAGARPGEPASAEGAGHPPMRAVPSAPGGGAQIAILDPAVPDATAPPHLDRRAVTISAAEAARRGNGGGKGILK